MRTSTLWQAPSVSLAELRRTMAAAGNASEHQEVLPFGVNDIDAALPGGGLAFALHEFSEGGVRGYNAASAALFAAGILARLRGRVLVPA
jgi:protein ImuA